MRKLFGRCRPSLALALSLASVAAMAEDKDPRLPSLGDLMVITQLRQFKLWYSAQAANWKLAEYQDEQLEKTLSRIAALYPETQKINQSQILRERVTPALGELRRAVANKDKAGFEKAYGQVTDACNACHRLTGVGFIAVRTPKRSPFSNQEFEPTP